jgi:cyclin H
MVTEDDMYRASTQYRLWNFTPERLAALRQKTNSMAREHVKAALKRKRKSSKKNPGGGASENDDTEADDVEIDFLTVDEERTLIDFFCVNLVTLARHSSFQLPTNVVVCRSAWQAQSNAIRQRRCNSSNASSSRIRS